MEHMSRAPNPSLGKSDKDLCRKEILNMKYSINILFDFHRFCEETEIHAYTKAIFSQMSHPIYLLYYCQRNSLQNAI